MSEIRHIPGNDIDRDRWDACINEAVNGNICAYAWYLDIVADDWDALVEGDYDFVMPLPYRRRFGFHYLYMPSFTQQLGPFGTGLLTPDRTRAFIDAIPRRFRYADINLNKHARIGDARLIRVENRNYELEMIRPYREISGAYSENLRRKLKKVGEHGLQLHRSQDPGPVIELFRANRGRELRTMGDKDYQVLRQLTYQLVHRGMGQVWTVFGPTNDLCAGMIVAESHNRSVFLFSGLSQEGRSLDAMPFLIDQYLRAVAGKERVFDFEGSNDPGLGRFYASFGARATTYQSVRINRMPFPISPVFSLYRLLRP